MILLCVCHLTWRDMTTPPWWREKVFVYYYVGCKWFLNIMIHLISFFLEYCIRYKIKLSVLKNIVP